MLNLDNVDSPEAWRCPFVLTSPRSLAACRLVGVKPVELLPRDIVDLAESIGTSDLAELADLRDVLEHRRLTKLEHCRAIRRYLISQHAIDENHLLMTYKRIPVQVHENIPRCRMEGGSATPPILPAPKAPVPTSLISSDNILPTRCTISLPRRETNGNDVQPGDVSSNRKERLDMENRAVASANVRLKGTSQTTKKSESNGLPCAPTGSTLSSRKQQRPALSEYCIRVNFGDTKYFRNLAKDSYPRKRGSSRTRHLRRSSKVRQSRTSCVSDKRTARFTERDKVAPKMAPAPNRCITQMRQSSTRSNATPPTSISNTSKEGQRRYFQDNTGTPTGSTVTSDKEVCKCEKIGNTSPRISLPSTSSQSPPLVTAGKLERKDEEQFVAQLASREIPDPLATAVLNHGDEVVINTECEKCFSRDISPTGKDASGHVSNIENDLSDNESGSITNTGAVLDTVSDNKRSNNNNNAPYSKKQDEISVCEVNHSCAPGIGSPCHCDVNKSTPPDNCYNFKNQHTGENLINSSPEPGTGKTRLGNYPRVRRSSLSNNSGTEVSLLGGHSDTESNVHSDFTGLGRTPTPCLLNRIISNHNFLDVLSERSGSRPRCSIIGNEGREVTGSTNSRYRRRSRSLSAGRSWRQSPASAISSRGGKKCASEVAYKGGKSSCLSQQVSSLISQTAYFSCRNKIAALGSQWRKTADVIGLSEEDQKILRRLERKAWEKKMLEMTAEAIRVVWDNECVRRKQQIEKEKEKRKLEVAQRRLADKLETMERRAYLEGNLIRAQHRLADALRRRDEEAQDRLAKIAQQKEAMRAERKAADFARQASVEKRLQHLNEETKRHQAILAEQLQNRIRHAQGRRESRISSALGNRRDHQVSTTSLLVLPDNTEKTTLCKRPSSAPRQTSATTLDPRIVSVRLVREAIDRADAVSRLRYAAQSEAAIRAASLRASARVRSRSLRARVMTSKRRGAYLAAAARLRAVQGAAVARLRSRIREGEHKIAALRAAKENFVASSRATAAVAAELRKRLRGTLSPATFDRMAADVQHAVRIPFNRVVTADQQSVTHIRLG